MRTPPQHRHHRPPGVAQRVAEERGEGPVGSPSSSVGYMIRGENRTGPSTRLAFCTTGVVLRRLQGGGTGALAASGVTHVVVDEVHERNLDADFLLLLAKRLLLSAVEGERGKGKGNGCVCAC